MQLPVWYPPPHPSPARGEGAHLRCGSNHLVSPSHRTRRQRPALSLHREAVMLIAFKLKLALACAAGLAGPLAVAPLLSDLPRRDAAVSEQSIIEVKPGTMSYRAAGDFTRSGKPAEAPLRTLRQNLPLAIMAHQVSAADYQACVDDGGCHALDRGVVIALDRPAVQVSFYDAQ